MELAKRAVACKGWRWMPGMLTDVGERVTDAEAFYLGTLPDLSDPATLGCLLALVREAWAQPGISTGLYNPQMGQWSVYDQNGDHLLQPMEGDAPLFLTEVAALIAALEAASCV